MQDDDKVENYKFVPLVGVCGAPGATGVYGWQGSAMKRHLAIKVCALGAALAAGVVTGQAGQVQATPRPITAGTVEVTGKPAAVGGEAIRWEPGTYRVRYVTAECTGYAPLDSASHKGMCYQGDPRVTASGARTKPGVTVAAAKHIPFGTKVYVPAHGVRVVEDRGGAIKGNKLDLCFKTRRAALEFGRRRVQVMVFERI